MTKHTRASDTWIEMQRRRWRLHYLVSNFENTKNEVEKRSERRYLFRPALHCCHLSITFGENWEAIALLSIAISTPLPVSAGVVTANITPEGRGTSDARRGAYYVALVLVSTQNCRLSAKWCVSVVGAAPCMGPGTSCTRGSSLTHFLADELQKLAV